MLLGQRAVQCRGYRGVRVLDTATRAQYSTCPGFVRLINTRRPRSSSKVARAVGRRAVTGHQLRHNSKPTAVAQLAELSDALLVKHDALSSHDRQPTITLGERGFCLSNNINQNSVLYRTSVRNMSS